ncbi:MAG: OmpW/AlkL family protein [Myxococcota bacterium]
MRALIVSLLVAAPSFAAEEAEPEWHGFSFRLGGLFIAPLGRSGEVELANVQGPAQLSVRDGPIAGSAVVMGTNLMPAVTLGYALPFLDRQLSIETILALPFTMSMYADGTLASQSLAPTALGNLPTGVPPLGRQLGEVKVLPPVLTAVWRFFPGLRVRPYVGLGVSYLIPLEARITNPVLTEVATPKLEVPPKLGFVIQAGGEVRLYKWFFATLDLKYIAGLDLEARVTNIWVRTPGLPLYEAVQVGDNVARISVNPLILQLGVGMNL